DRAEVRERRGQLTHRHRAEQVARLHPQDLERRGVRHGEVDPVLRRLLPVHLLCRGEAWRGEKGGTRERQGAHVHPRSGRKSCTVTVGSPDFPGTSSSASTLPPCSTVITTTNLPSLPMGFTVATHCRIFPFWPASLGRVKVSSSELMKLPAPIERRLFRSAS